MYPSRLTWVEVEGLSGPLCGRSRPGHFRGVCTVVTKLWNLVRPDIAVFGNKDYQQLAILRRMHSDLFLSGEIVGHPIVREPDGLAMSSRNANLSPSGRTQALAIFRFLHEVERRFSNGERQAERLLANADRLLHPGSIDYVELVDADDLSVVTTVERASLCAVAVFFEGVRLLDNVVLHP
jgi:pantoate--beta-alanine ligase